MYRFISGILIILASLCISCDDSNLNPPEDIASAKQLWESVGYSDYSMEVERSCFCPPPRFYTAIIETNKVVRVIDSETGENVNAEGGYPTIDELFAWLEQIAPEKPEKLDLEFHPELGHPTFIDYNQSHQIVDEELFMKIENLEVN